MLAVITSWLTPTVLFCLMNLMVATIFLSHKNPGPESDPTHPLPRAPSLIERVPSLLLERVRSINFNSLYSEPHEHDLPRTLSLLERVRSINFNGFNSEPHQYDPDHHLPRAPSVPERARPTNFNSLNSEPHGRDPDHHLPRTPSVPDKFNNLDSEPHQHDPDHHLLERVSYTNFNTFNSEPHHQRDPDHHLPRAPSLLERVRSVNFSPFSAGETDAETRSEIPTRPTRTPSILERVWSNKFYLHRSDSVGTDARKPDPNFEEPAAAARVRKSASEKSKSKPETSRELDDGVDGKAADFINKFRQQLKLQRLDSLLRVKEMLNRGA